MLATGGKDGSIAVWETRHDGTGGTSTARLLHTFSGHAAGVVRVCFSTNGKRLISSSVDGSVAMWNVQSTLPSAALGSAYPSATDYTRQLPNLLETMDEMEDDVST